MYCTVLPYCIYITAVPLPGICTRPRAHPPHTTAALRAPPKIPLVFARRRSTTCRTRRAERGSSQVCGTRIWLVTRIRPYPLVPRPAPFGWAHLGIPTHERRLSFTATRTRHGRLRAPLLGGSSCGRRPLSLGPARFSRSGSRCGAFLVPWWCLLALGLGVAFLVPCSFKEIQISREEILSRFLDFCISA